ncbi:MAG TPA: methylamine utilization protein MauJ, partial [Blastocatellia bacterium]|nr:methylamine utilization protein MauJ [Blastocatellia bacterium]
LPENQISFAETLVGDSHLLIGPPTTDQADEEPSQITFSASTKDGEFEFTGYPNSKGCLERIVLESINAGDFHQATMKAFHGLMPALSQMSLYFDIPFHIYQTQAIELRTNSRRCSVIAPYTQKALQDLAFNNFSEELCKYAALYREAMNSNSFNYQFLCYYKIIEGLDKRRERLIIEAKQRGESIPSSPRLMIPHTPTEQFEWLKSIFPVRWPWGKPTLSAIFPPELCAKQRKVRDVVQNELVAIRNKIAHSVLDDGEPTISIDYAVDIELVGRWLPLTKCIARLYMKEAFPECFRPLVIT